MNDEHFRRQLHRLETQFGKYGSERAHILWREVKNLSDEWFTKAIDSMLATFRQTPLPSDFFDEIARERELRAFAEKKEKAFQNWKEPLQFKCSQCKDLGYMTKIIEQYELPGVYAFQCDCETGRKYQKFPKIYG